MVSVLAASAVNRGFETRSGKTKYYEICMCGFSNRIGGVMVSVLAASAVDRGFRLRSGQIKDNKIGIYCFSTGWLGMRIMCPNGAICLSTDCCFSEIAP